MLFGLITGGPNEYPEPCLVADKPSTFSTPVKVRTLFATEYAVHLLSIEEGFIVEVDPSDNSLVVTPVRPNKLHLTPNLPERPGFSVGKIKIIHLDEHHYQVYFDRERGWEPWQPNVRIY